MTNRGSNALEDFILPIGVPPRLYALKSGDEFYVSRDTYKIPLGEFFPGSPAMCIQLIKRDKWWQFWKPRYKGAIYRIMGDK